MVINRIVARVAAGMVAVALPPLAHSGGVVTDTNAASLRAAVAGGGTVYFATTGTVLVASTILISTDVSLIDTNRSVIISGSGGRGPLFRVSPGVEFSASGLTLANGVSSNGGAIYSAGSLFLDNCVFSNNIAAGSAGALGASGSFGTVLGTAGGAGQPGVLAAGGAIYSIGTAVVAQCIFLTNQAIGGNGGVGGTGGGSNNKGGDGGQGGAAGSAAGGAIYSVGFLEVSNTLFRFNAARGGSGGAGGTNGAAPIPGAHGDGGTGNSAFGGALFATGGDIIASTFHVNSTLAGNSANAAADTHNFTGVGGIKGPDAYGGAVCSQGTLDIVNCTFATNSVGGGRGGNGGNGIPYGGNGADGGNAWGGSIYVAAGASAHVTNCTVVAGATVPGAAGLKGAGLLSQDGLPGNARGANLANAGYFVIKNTILAYSTNSGNAYGTIIDGLNNLSSDGTPTTFTSSHRHIDPMLLGLANYGGPTPTMSPKSTSPAVNAGDCAGVPAVDQRGYPRDGVCDVGAVELQTSVPVVASAVLSRNQLLVSWPAAASYYSLWSAKSLQNTVWTPVTNAVKLDGEVLKVIVPITLTNRVQFFRLEPQ